MKPRTPPPAKPPHMPTLREAETAFTAEGSPPPGHVSSDAPPLSKAPARPRTGSKTDKPA